MRMTALVPMLQTNNTFYVDDVGELWNAVKEQWTAEWGPEKMSYGLIEFAVKDPNGYLLSFGRQPNSRLARVRI